MTRDNVRIVDFPRDAVLTPIHTYISDDAPFKTDVIFSTFDFVARAGVPLGVPAIYIAAAAFSLACKVHVDGYHSLEDIFSHFLGIDPFGDEVFKDVASAVRAERYVARKLEYRLHTPNLKTWLDFFVRTPAENKLVEFKVISLIMSPLISEFTAGRPICYRSLAAACARLDGFECEAEDRKRETARKEGSAKCIEIEIERCSELILL